MRMRTGPRMKGRQVAAPGGKRSGNNTGSAEPRLRGKAVAPTQGRTRNHPNTAPIPKENIGGVLPNTFYANSRTPVHPNFDTSKKHD